jgi:hypothetical protein
MLSCSFRFCHRLPTGMMDVSTSPTLSTWSLGNNLPDVRRELPVSPQLESRRPLVVVGASVTQSPSVLSLISQDVGTKLTILTGDSTDERSAINHVLRGLLQPPPWVDTGSTECHSKRRRYREPFHCTIRGRLRRPKVDYLLWLFGRCHRRSSAVFRGQRRHVHSSEIPHRSWLRLLWSCFSTAHHRARSSLRAWQGLCVVQYAILFRRYGPYSAHRTSVVNSH